MTTYAQVEKRCALCGQESTQRVLASTNTRGAPDLDFRPPPMMRDTMGAWLEICPHCGLCALEIEEAEGSWGQVVQSPAYQAQLASDQSSLARRFACWALIAEETAPLSEVISAYKQLAWVYDDLVTYAQRDGSAEGESDECLACGTPENAGDLARWSAAATEWRKRAADALELAQEQDGQEAGWLVLTDLWRRAGCFDRAEAAVVRALASCKSVEALAVLKFQRRLIQSQDTAAHTLDEVGLPQTGEASVRAAERRRASQPLSLREVGWWLVRILLIVMALRYLFRLFRGWFSG